MKYRVEIDGLRALAVVPVILYHAGFQFFSGGYLGVDVFFVISGYLITSIIISEMSKGKFSLVRFYERRTRRILPALLLVLLFSTPFAWVYLPANEMKNFTNSILAVLTFSSNILFWLQSGYFDTAAELKPLLHTWSLAVEEQYYVIYPLFLMIVYRYFKKRCSFILWLIFFTSFVVALWAVKKHTNAAFFLLPSRGWELILGALCAVYLKDGVSISSNRVVQPLSLLGLAMVICSFLVFNKQTATPSLSTLVPTIGTVLIILFSVSGTIVNRLLSGKLIVSLGLVSYSAYLIHQPMFVFIRYAIDGPVHHYIYIIASVITFVLAFASWRFIENPFRSKETIQSWKFLSVLSALFLVLVTVGCMGRITDGFKDTTNPSHKKTANQSYISELIKTKPYLSDDIYLLGDSHAEHLAFGLKKITSGVVNDLSSNGCIPFRNVDRYDYRFTPGSCADYVNKTLDSLHENDFEGIVVLSTMGPVYLDGTPFKGKDSGRVTGLGVELIDNKSITDRWEVFETGMRNTLSELSEIKGIKIVFVIDIPELGIDYGCTRHKQKKSISFGPITLTDLVGRREEECRVDRQLYDQRVVRYKKLIHTVLSDYPEVSIFDPTNLFCDDAYCYGFKDEFGYLYRNVDHLGPNGSLYVARAFAEFLRNI